MVSVEIVNVTFIRVVWLSILILMLVWILEYMGGFATSPEDLPNGGNNTSSLFNWHPLMMTLAFPVITTEALLVYSAFPFDRLPRFYKKVIHGVCHLLALIFMVLGLVAVFRSHTQHKPKAIDDIYSPHSYLGITTMVFSTFQFLGGVVLYVLPVFSDETKKKWRDYHAFLGVGSFFCALTTMLVGIQDKTRLNQKKGLHISPHGKYGALATIPASIGPLMIILAVTVGFQLVFLQQKKVQEVSEEGPSETMQAPLIIETAAAEEEAVEISKE